jgi:methionyl-tRNA synthetase
MVSLPGGPASSASAGPNSTDVGAGTVTTEPANRYYITTSIPYVNAPPHVGHALEMVQTDVFARYHRLRGDDTRFLTGTDENSLKNVQAAEREGISTLELVDRNAQSFLDLLELLHVSHDDFIRTAVDPRHLSGAARLWEALDASGDLYKRSYQGLYCVGCEQFYDEDELVDGLCPEHGVRPELVEEENYFFRLSRYQDRLLEFIDSGRLRIIPDSRRNEVRSFISRGLEDFSVSRSRDRARGWGVPVPGDPDQVMYVWVDALANYITALGFGKPSEHYERYWVDSPERVHCIGKGILRFHAVYWPAMLLSAGEPLPTLVFVHGYLTIAGGKISKSLGNTVDPIELCNRYGTDAVRYWLLREVPPTDDADYTDEKLERRYNADLANDLGNLLNRTVSMIARYRDGEAPALGSAGAQSAELRALASDLPARIHHAMAKHYNPQAALAAISEVVVRANRYVEEMAPWVLARAEHDGDPTAGERLDETLSHLAEMLRVICQSTRPFLPSSAERMAKQLGIELTTVDWPRSLEWGAEPHVERVGKAQPIFPRIESGVPATD